MLLGAGLVALAVAGVASIAFLAGWRRGHVEQHRWPRANATVRQCRVVTHNQTIDGSTLLNEAECTITFTAAGKRVDGGFTSRPSANRAPLDAWVAQHPPGTPIAVRYDPEWPPHAVPEGPPRLFDVNAATLYLRAAFVAGVTAFVLLVAVFALRQRRPSRS